MKLLTIDGMTIRNACGKMMKDMAFPVVQAQRIGRLILALGNGLQAAATTSAI